MAYNGTFLSAGKLLGGSSSINDMIYLRGNPQDYNSWAGKGDDSWSYAKVLPYFLKSENNQHGPFVKRRRNKFHSSEGLNKVGYFHSGDTSTFAFKDALRELGHVMVDDFNAKEHVGFGIAQGTVYKGVRESAAKAYLIPAKDRPNLHIIKRGQATQIMFDEGGRATGVKFVLGGRRFKVAATKEVILSAGAINTPQLLMLSGIGPTRHIRKFDIRQQNNLPVGENLQDHVSVPLFLNMNTSSRVSSEEIMDNIFNYLRARIGSLNHIGSYDFVSFVNTTDATAVYPNIQYTYNTYIVNDIQLEAVQNNLDPIESVAKKIRTVSQEFNTAMVQVVLLKPKSRGKVRLQSTIPVEKPKVIGGYLTSKHDMDTLLAGVREYLKLLETKAMTTAGVQMIRFDLDICDDFTYDSDAYWECYIMHFAKGSHNVVGTAKMGPDTDSKAVVDLSLKVKGVQGLRVIDASVMPEIVSSGTNAATMMIAERGSDFIKDTWNKKLEL